MHKKRAQTVAAVHAQKDFVFLPKIKLKYTVRWKVNQCFFKKKRKSCGENDIITT